MQVNIGRLDRALRVVAGLLLIGLSLFGVIGWWGWLGLILVVTGIIRFCPSYWLLKLSCKRQRGG